MGAGLFVRTFAQLVRRGYFSSADHAFWIRAAPGSGFGWHMTIILTLSVFSGFRSEHEKAHESSTETAEKTGNHARQTDPGSRFFAACRPQGTHIITGQFLHGRPVSGIALINNVMQNIRVLALESAMAGRAYELLVHGIIPGGFLIRILFLIWIGLLRIHRLALYGSNRSFCSLKAVC